MSASAFEVGYAAVRADRKTVTDALPIDLCDPVSDQPFHVPRWVAELKTSGFTLVWNVDTGFFRATMEIWKALSRRGATYLFAAYEANMASSSRHYSNGELVWAIHNAGEGAKPRIVSSGATPKRYTEMRNGVPESKITDAGFELALDVGAEAIAFRYDDYFDEKDFVGGVFFPFNLRSEAGGSVS